MSGVKSTQQLRYADLFLVVSVTVCRDEGLAYALDFEASNYQLEDADDPESVVDVRPLLTGQIKWDGCINVSTVGIMHGCERSDVTRLAVLFDRLYDLALEMMPQHRRYLSLEHPRIRLPAVSTPPAVPVTPCAHPSSSVDAYEVRGSMLLWCAKCGATHDARDTTGTWRLPGSSS